MFNLKGDFYRCLRIWYVPCHHTDPVLVKKIFTLYQCQTVREVFARQLMQISGISGDKAAAILEHYSTVSRYEHVTIKSISLSHSLILYC